MQTFRLRSLRAYLYLAGAAAVIAIAVAILASGGGVASAHTSRALVNDSNRLVPVSPTIPAKVGCSTLKSLPSLVTIPHFPTSIDSTTDVPAAAGNPTYCDVKGMIAPQTHFEIKLPENTWQGRYLQNGCGGYCGTVSNQTFPACDAQLGGDFAMATDDEGHTTSSGLGGAGLFAFNSQKLRNEYGYESEHALAVVTEDRAAKDGWAAHPCDFVA